MNDTHSEGSAHTYENLQALLFSSADIDGFLQDLTRLAAELVPDVSVGITTRHRGSALTVASSDKRAEFLDETQYRNEGGPCLEALHTGLIVHSPNTSTETRWPDYTAVARKQGLQASLSLPMNAGGPTALAAMNVYSFTPSLTFETAERQTYETFAAQAAVSLRLATRLDKDGVLLDQLEQALNSRTVIDQALGMIMMQQRCTATEAFDLLRRQSQNNHRKLRDVATDLITQISGQSPTPPKPFSSD